MTLAAYSTAYVEAVVRRRHFCRHQHLATPRDTVAFAIFVRRFERWLATPHCLSVWS